MKFLLMATVLSLSSFVSMRAAADQSKGYKCQISLSTVEKGTSVSEWKYLDFSNVKDKESRVSVDFKYGKAVFFLYENPNASLGGAQKFSVSVFPKSYSEGVTLPGAFALNDSGLVNLEIINPIFAAREQSLPRTERYFKIVQDLVREGKLKEGDFINSLTQCFEAGHDESGGGR